MKYENADIADKPDQIVSDIKPVTLLPIHIDSTDYLIHAIGEIQPFSSRGFSSDYSNDYSYGSVSYSGYTLSGNFSNLHFEHLETHKTTSVTDKPIKFSSARFLQSIYNMHGQELLLYHAYDLDTDGNRILNDNDVEALFLSNIDGSNFTKLTKDFQDLIDHKVIPENNRIYFRTMVDTNKDGIFNKDDDFKNYYVDLNNPDWTAIHYNFIN